MPNLRDVIAAWAADPNAGPFIPRSELQEEPSNNEWMHEIASLPPIFMPVPPRIASMYGAPRVGMVENGEPIVTATCSRCQTPNSQCVQRLAPGSSELSRDTYVMECLPCATGGSIVRNRRDRMWVYPTRLQGPDEAMRELYEQYQRREAGHASNLIATGAMIVDANRLRPRFEDYTVAEDIDESTVPSGRGLTDAVDVQRYFNERTINMLQDGREVARIENLEVPPSDLDTDRDRAYYMDPRMFTPNPILQGNDRSHRRVRPGLCRCQYTTVFTGDMDRHIECANAPLGPANEDGLHRWMPCDRCFDYGNCRQVASSVYQPPGGHTWYATTSLPEPPSTVSSYRCDECIDAAR